MPRERLVRSWFENAEAWTRAVRDGLIESRRLATDEAVVAALMESTPTRVLDVGCGEGWLCRTLASHGVDVVGIDVSLPLVEAARAAGGGRFEQVAYDDLAEVADALGRFDAVACNFALLDEDLAPLLHSLKAMLAAEGRLVIQTVHPWGACGEEPYRDGWRLETFAGFGGQVFPEAMPWYFRTLGSWHAALSAAGFRVLALREPSHPETGRPLSLLMVCTRGA
ncbi:MAG: methyltransferase domain-containing protein [Pseudoxanthomonas sp.]|nr:methyltransferase domain-containing protein [Pseudoxanthomonas sp.]